MSTADQPGPHNALIDVAGIRVGHFSRVGDGYLTGCTVVLAPDGGMVAGVDVRGGGPGTRETDLLNPSASVERIHALVLTGGSAYGLAAADGVMAALADLGTGLPVGPNPGEVVPLVPAAVLFDLGRGGRFRATPTSEFGAAALAAALAAPIPTPSPTDRPAAGAEQGSVGAATGAITRNLKGAIGTASIVLPNGTTVAALVAVNAAGSPVDADGTLLGARLLLPADGPTPAVPGESARAALRELTAPPVPGFRFDTDAQDPAGAEVIRNTTLAVVATDAALTKAQCTKMAAVAQNGLARALNPVHTMFDGDVVFGVSTATGAAPDPFAFHEITVAAADVLTRAIVRGLLAATGVSTPAGSWPSWSEVAFPAAGGQ